MEKKNTIKLEDLQKMIEEAETQEAVFWGKELVVSYRLKNGFTVSGRAACVDPANFNLEIGYKVAKANAIEKMWQLEGYLLQNRLHEASEL
jgi:hypothetical protein